MSDEDTNQVPEPEEVDELVAQRGMPGAAIARALSGQPRLSRQSGTHQRLADLAAATGQRDAAWLGTGGPVRRDPDAAQRQYLMQVEIEEAKRRAREQREREAAVQRAVSNAPGSAVDVTIRDLASRGRGAGPPSPNPDGPWHRLVDRAHQAATSDARRDQQERDPRLEDPDDLAHENQMLGTPDARRVARRGR